jgi:hypothetical protein
MAAYEAAKGYQKMKRGALTINRWVREGTPLQAKRFHFWYLGVLRLCVGIAQIIVVLWCFVLLLRHGINAQTMHVAFVGAGITTASLLLFKVLNRTK